MNRLWRSSIAVALVLILTIAFDSEWVRQQLPFLVTAQLWFHQRLTSWNPRPPRVKWVVLAEVDDDTFWQPPFSGIQPTSRRYLADLALRIAEVGPTAIGLDFQIKSPGSQPGDDSTRASDNDYLLEAVRAITKKGIPVVVTTGFFDNQKGEWQRFPNIYPDGLLPHGAVFGHINLPLDRRQIPLQMEALDWDGSGKYRYDSFAQKLVSAHEDATHVGRKTMEKQDIATALRQGDFVFGGFVSPTDFPRISAGRLLQGSKTDLAMCRSRVVIAGATWHRDAANRGPLVEEFLSPMGTVPGLYLHANYVEALLDDRFSRALPLKFSLGLDLLLAGVLYYLFGKAGNLWRGLLLVFFFVPMFAAYVVSTNLGRYLDFVLPFTICLFHLGSEFVADYVRLRGRS